MMRHSNKTAILNAAIAVIEADGITAVTFDAVAAQAELTRGGILYHFPSRDDLIAAVHQHLADDWERLLVDACGKNADEATPRERTIAYVRVAATAATRAELQMLLDSRNTSDYKPWADVLARWTHAFDETSADTSSEELWMAQLAADGLWVNDAINKHPVPEAQRTRIVDRIVARL